MSQSINGFIPVLTDTIASAGTADILEGFPIGYNGQYATASTTIAGIAMQDILSATNADNHLGRSQLGASLEIMLIGRCKLIAAGAISAGDYIRVAALSGSNGSFVSVGTTWETGVIGKAITAASGDGQKFDALIGSL